MVDIKYEVRNNSNNAYYIVPSTTIAPIATPNPILTVDLMLLSVLGRCVTQKSSLNVVAPCRLQDGSTV